MSDREFVLDDTEETKETFWRKVFFNKPSGDAARREYLRCEFEILSQAEIDDLIQDESGASRPDANARLLRRALINADIKRRGEDGKLVEAEFTEELKESLLGRPYFTSAAAVVYVYAMNGAAPRERKTKN